MRGGAEIDDEFVLCVQQLVKLDSRRIWIWIYKEGFELDRFHPLYMICRICMYFVKSLDQITLLVCDMMSCMSCMYEVHRVSIVCI